MSFPPRHLRRRPRYDLDATTLSLLRAGELNPWLLGLAKRTDAVLAQVHCAEPALPLRPPSYRYIVAFALGQPPPAFPVQAGLFGPGPCGGFAALDVSTTGFRQDLDRVYEVAVVTFAAGGDVIERWHTLVRPEGDPNPGNNEKGSRSRVLDQAPTFSDIVGDLVARIRTGPVVGHNVIFDLGMVQAEMGRLGSGLPTVPYVCTFNLAYALALDSPSNRLGVLCRALGVPMENWHTALADAEAAGRLLFRLIAEAQARHAGHLLAVSLYPGPATAWPALPYFGRVLERDPRVLPPTGDQPDEALDALLGSAPPVASVVVKLDVMSMLPPETKQKLARVLAEAKAARATADAAKTDDQRLAERQREEALDAAQRDWERAGFAGETGLSRLQAILAAFADNDEQDELAEASLRYAELLRYTPGHGTAEVDAAYRAAYEVATRADTASGDGGLEVDEQGGTKRILDNRFPFPRANDVLDNWSDFALARRDIEVFLELAPERRRCGGEAFVYGLGRYLTQRAVVERAPEDSAQSGQRRSGSLGRPGGHNRGS